MKLFAVLVRSIAALRGRRRDNLNRSRLMGLYMMQANGKDGAASEYHLRRERRNGKYSHNRERA